MTSGPRPPWVDHDIYVTHFLVVSDQERSCRFYRDVLGATVLRPGDPAVLDLHGSVLILNVGGAPTEDKPGIVLSPPSDASPVSAFLNIRVRDLAAAYERWRDLGAQWLTEPIDRGPELRAFLRDPDGHLIEVGQTLGY